MDERLRLAVGDAAVVVGVVVAGQVSHGTTPLAAPLSTAETLASFLAGWLVAAGLVGVYSGDDLRRSWRLVAGAWLAGANLGLIARASPLFSGGAAWPFPLVITGTTLGMLLLWRGALVALSRVRTPTGRPAGD
ncbi:DUF3054 domain-containing protein [Halobacteriales archaeon SW_5_70_135]|nr:MAG: DUF3054 domain-containing protein [Halobacteriales archaeon SW_5_70_135]